MMDGLCGKCAWCMEGHYCRRKHKEVAFFGQEKCYTTEDEFRIMFAQQVKDIEQDTNKLTQNAKKSTQKAKKMEEKTITTKVCKDCGRELPIEEFQRQAKSKDGYMHICKECKQKRYVAGVSLNVAGLNIESVAKGKDNGQRKILTGASDQQLVEELRSRGFDVNCTKTISL